MIPEELIKDLIASRSKREIIRILAGGGVISISEIAVKIKRNKSTISRHSNELEKMGLITRRKGPLNKRRSYLSLTEKGKETAGKLG